MKLNIKKDTEALRVPASCIDSLCDADVNDLRVLLYFAANEESFDAALAAEELGTGEGDVKSSLKFWCGAGVIKKGARAQKEKAKEKDTTVKKPKALPEKRTAFFSASELCEIAEENVDFKVLLDAAQQTAGWIFNTSEIEIIAALYVNMHLSSEYILALIGYYVCKREKPLRYLEKVAYTLIDDGVATPDALEERLRYLEKFDGYEGMVRRLFGLGARTLTKKEKDILALWLDEYGYGEEIIKEAYEITVNNTGKASLMYANTILKNWHDEGVKALKDIGKKGTAKKASPKTTRQGTATARTFDPDEAFKKALERSYNGEK